MDEISGDMQETGLNELKDGGLRQAIVEIVKSCSRPANNSHEVCTEQQGDALEQAKLKYPNFEAFMDKLLVITGVLERETQQEDLAEWLTRINQSEHDGLGPLVIKPIERKRRPPRQNPNGITAGSWVCRGTSPNATSIW